MLFLTTYPVAFSLSLSLSLSQLRVAVVRSEKPGRVRELRGRGTSAVGNRYKATASEN
jgi:hypothetical protein